MESYVFTFGFKDTKTGRTDFYILPLREYKLPKTSWECSRLLCEIGQLICKLNGYDDFAVCQWERLEMPESYEQLVSKMRQDAVNQNWTDFFH